MTTMYDLLILYLLGFGRELFDYDTDRISPHLERAMEVCPLIRNAEIQNVINGPMPSTADFEGLLGPYLGVDNFWCCNGQMYVLVFILNKDLTTLILLKPLFTEFFIDHFQPMGASNSDFTW